MYKVIKIDDAKLENKLNELGDSVMTILPLEMRDKFDYVIITKK